MPTYTVLQNGCEYDTSTALPRAIELAEVLIDGVAPGQDSTVTVLDEDGALKASVTTRRIVGTFVKQHWRNDSVLVEIGTEPFDATDSVLLLSLECLQSLEDRRDSTDALGADHVQWSGPFDVEIVSSICDYFGVSFLDEITEEALIYARGRANPAPWLDSVESLTVRVSLRRAPGVSVEDALGALRLQVSETRAGVVAWRVEVEGRAEA